MKKTYYCATFVTWDGQFQVQMCDTLLAAQQTILEFAKKKGFDAATIDDLWTVRAGLPLGEEFNINIEKIVIEEDSASIPITFLERADIDDEFTDPTVSELFSDADMNYIAEKMREAYLNGSFYPDLREAVENMDKYKSHQGTNQERSK